MKVLLVDASEIFRMGLRAALADAPGSGDLAVVGECSSGHQACEVSAALVPDVVVTDLHLPDQSGIALARDLRRSDPHARVLILAPLGPESVVHQAVAAGASGYALKGQSPEAIVGAIRDVGRGVWSSRPASRRCRHARPKAPTRAPRRRPSIVCRSVSAKSST